MRAKSLLKQLLPKSAGNLYRRRDETRALAAITTSECDVQHLAKQSLDVVLPTPSEWAAIEERALLPQQWRDASTSSDYHVRVTAKHAQALTGKMHEIFTQLREDADDDPDAAEFVFQFQAFPRPGYLGGEPGGETA